MTNDDVKTFPMALCDNQFQFLIVQYYVAEI